MRRKKMSKKEKSENRKALPKFLGFVLVCSLFGGIIGGISGFMGGTVASENLVEGIYHALDLGIPYCMSAVTILLVICEIRLYLQAKAIYKKWDGEEEESIEKAEEKLSWAILFSGTQMILSFFFYGVYHVVSKSNGPGSLIMIVAFILGMFAILIMQQKTVDLVKKINPEKKGSVYDPKFSKKWMESCDENERNQVGQACYKAYNSVVYTCCILWVVLFFGAFYFDIGILPITIVTLIWIVSQSVYGYECIRLSRHN